MAFHDFKEVIDSQHGVVEIKLQGMGEPVLGGKVFFRMIEYARRKHIWVRTTTNASILHKHENFRKLIDADPNEVQISIDGTSKETFERIRAGSNFELVTQNCKLINGYCNSLGLLKTRMWVCLQRENFSEFLDFVKLADELGFHRLSFALNLHGWGQMEYFNKNKALSVDEELTFDLAMEAIRLGGKFGIDVSFWNNVSKYNSKKRETICPWPFERAYVSSDMRIVPCCMIANPDILDFGDARDFSERWHSREYVGFRMAHLEGAVPDACRGCYADTEGEE
jgi:pyrroloquinoline quinone biosynthesis protein E